MKKLVYYTLGYSIKYIEILKLSIISLLLILESKFVFAVDFSSSAELYKIDKYWRRQKENEENNWSSSNMNNVHFNQF